MNAAGDSPLNNVAGVVTFESGETAGSIRIPIPQESFSDVKDLEKLSVALEHCDALLPVVVHYDVIAAIVELDREQFEVQQSEGKLKLNVKRTKQKKGKLIVPWKIQPKSSDSVYMNISG